MSEPESRKVSGNRLGWAIVLSSAIVVYLTLTRPFVGTRFSLAGKVVVEIASAFLGFGFTCDPGGSVRKGAYITSGILTFVALILVIIGRRA